MRHSKDWYQKKFVFSPNSKSNENVDFFKHLENDGLFRKPPQKPASIGTTPISSIVTIDQKIARAVARALGMTPENVLIEDNYFVENYWNEDGIEDNRYAFYAWIRTKVTPTSSFAKATARIANNIGLSLSGKRVCSDGMILRFSANGTSVKSRSSIESFYKSLYESPLHARHEIAEYIPTRWKRFGTDAEKHSVTGKFCNTNSTRSYTPDHDDAQLATSMKEFVRRASYGTAFNIGADILASGNSAVVFRMKTKADEYFIARFKMLLMNKFDISSISYNLTSDRKTITVYGARKIDD